MPYAMELKAQHKKTFQIPEAGRANKSRSGAGMDKKVVARSTPWKKAIVFTCGVIIVAALVWGINQTGERALSVDKNRLNIATVERGIFEDFIPLRGRVTPAKTVFLDAIEGGRVEAIFVEDGATLEAGDMIARLSNTSLQLSVTSNEALVAEQLNNMRSIELQLEQNRLQHKRNLLDINHQIRLLTRQLDHEQELLNNNLIAKNQVDDTRDTLAWYTDTLTVSLESQRTDELMQEQQLAFLKSTGEQLEKALQISRQNLENMNIRAPVAGKLSGFDAEIGQSIARGGRLGQIDTPDDFKVSAFIDEFYLGRVGLEQQASLSRNNQSFSLSISKIYPQVRNGQFEVDLQFDDQKPGDIRRGQTLQTRLQLSDAEPAFLIPNAAFFQDTGGNWIFVVSEDGSEAVKRNIKTGRRNNQYIEVISGLAADERVIVSSYGEYQQIERLNLDL